MCGNKSGNEWIHVFVYVTWHVSARLFDDENIDSADSDMKKNLSIKLKKYIKSEKK